MADRAAAKPARGPLAMLEDALHAVGCTALLAVLVLITLDVVLRATLSRTVSFQFELTEMFLMPALATLSLARVQRIGGHLAIDFVDLSRLGVLGAVARRLNTALPAVFFAAVAWQSGKYAWNAWLRDDNNMGVVDWPMYVAYSSIPLGTGLLAVRLAVETFSRQGKNEKPEEI
ncbi:MAG: TRAP transporter small permease [Hyphomicrobiaceae bacterium]